MIISQNITFNKNLFYSDLKEGTPILGSELKAVLNNITANNKLN